MDKVSESDVVKWMGECSEAGLVRLYQVAGKPYLEILNFKQRMRAAKSKFPAPDTELPTNDGHLPDTCQQPAAYAEAEAEAETEAKTRARADTKNSNLIEFF